jgi:hypothetical protein
MAAKSGFALFFFLPILLFTFAGCAGSSGAGPINGPFSNSSLNGSYSFSFTGVNGAGFLAVAGAFQANGTGSITGGRVDINSGTGIFTNVSLTGTYNVHNNGQGTATLNAGGSVFDLDFVMISSQRALVIRFDNNSTASGSIDIQTSSAFSLSALAGSLVFNIAGIDSGGHSEGSAGVFTVDSSGNLTGGVEDTNDDGTVSANIAIAPATAAMSTPTNGRGTLSITAGGTTRNFVYYVVDANHIRMIEVDLSPVLAGDVFRQSSAAISGSFAFTVGGVSTGGPFVAGGILNTDGAGHILSTSVEDINNGGSVTQNIALSGSYAIGGNGRGTVSLNSGAINLVAYPSTGGIQVLEVDSTTAASGTALQQSGGFSSGSLQGNYGTNFTGVLLGAEVDANAQFSADGVSHLTGALDLNNAGALSSNLTLSGNFTVSGSGRGTMSLSSSLGNQNLVFYMVSNTRVLFIDVDSNLVAVGEMDHQ